MKTNAEITMEDQLFALQQRNLVYNYNFLYYSNTTGNTPVVYNHPDGWVYNDSGTDGMITFRTGDNCCQIVNSTSGSMTFTQALNEFPRSADVLPGKKVTASAIVASPNVGCELTFYIYDGIEKSTKSINFQNTDQQEITIDIEINPAAQTLVVGIESQSPNDSIYIYSICANIGSVALSTLPCMVEGFISDRKQYLSTDIPPAQELSLCQPSAELGPGYSRLNSVLNGKFGTGTNGRSMLPDFSGYFSRAWDNGAGIDTDAAGRTALGTGTITGDNVGTVEQDEFKSHNHQLEFDTSGKLPAGTSSPLPVINTYTTSNTGSTGGSETRGKNISELYTMKWA